VSILLQFADQKQVIGPLATRNRSSSRIDDLKPILVTGATGNVGRELVAQLRAAGRAVRALTRNPKSANLPADVEIVAGDPERTRYARRGPRRH
jgi:NADPH:quinone reductase-like Zn-dependent oxidoreductase